MSTRVCADYIICIRITMYLTMYSIVYSNVVLYLKRILRTASEAVVAGRRRLYSTTLQEQC
jgi:hypothetical protein